MKPTLFSLLAMGVVAVGLTAYAQNAGQPANQAQGSGTTPHAWCDRNGDGICDVTGMPVGQGRGHMMSPDASGQQGRGMGRGLGRGMSCPYRQNAQSTDPSSQPGVSPTK
jgi:hypothetical protein